MKPPAFILILALGLYVRARADDVAIEAHGLRVRVDGVSKDAAEDVKSVIEEQAVMTEDQTVSPPLADDFAFFVRQRYHELGYREAVVTWSVASDVALLHVNEGDRYSVGAITFKGNNSQADADLKEYLLRSTHEKLGTTGQSVPFVEADLKAGAELVQRYFQAQGYLNAAVAPPVFASHPNAHTVDVLLNIREGRRFNFGTVRAIGDLKDQEREVDKKFEGLSGQPFSEVKVETIRKELIGIYERLGHYTATVRAEADVIKHPDGNVPVVYHIAPGPLFHVAGVDIAPGFSHGAQRIIRSNFKRATGSIYSPSELEFTTRRALDTDVFSRLDVKPRTGPDNTLVLDITGEEAMRTTLSASLGYETFQGPIIAAEARQVNFMDTGDSARIKVEYTARGINGGIKLLDPAIFDSPYSLDAELTAQAVNIFDYDRRTLGFRTTLKRQWNKHISANVFGEVSKNTTSTDKLTPAELGPPDYQLGTVGASILLDYRNSPVLPSRGWMGSLTITSASGNTSYLRSDAVFAYYQPITKKLRAAFSAKSSAIQNSGGVENLPIDLRVFNGGTTSVRSFAEREMGPHSRAGDTPLGGLLSQTFSVELSYETIPNLELAVFGDAGNLKSTVDNPFSQPSGLRYAIGLGLRYKLPIGPLRIDYGVNPNPRGGEPFGALHITFGFAF